MRQQRLADFIRGNIEAILQAWEDFARTIEPPALTMDDEGLRDHAHDMLLGFARDLDTDQSDKERAAKSMGQGERTHRDTAAEIHAEARLLSGYTAVQLVSEYRALRASVLALWSQAHRNNPEHDLEDMMRFNEAIDQALAESVARYQDMVKQSHNMFVAILGHDLRNPLGTMVTGSGFVMQATDIPPKYVLVATRMFSSARRMSKLVNDLIDFTRTHLGPGIPVRVRHDNLAAVCKQVVDELRTFHPERRIELHAPPQLDALFDDGRIAQVVSNLLGNAIQYGRPDTPATLRLTGNDDEIMLTINNQGSSIPADKIAIIFDPFVRITGDVAAALADEADHPERTSLGIGLFIAREIIQAHGGRIAVASTTAEGTTFTITMPRQPTSRAGDDPGHVSGARDSGARTRPAT